MAPEGNTFPPDQLFWALRLNHRAANLMLAGPQSTLQLTATAFNAEGDSLTEVELPRFRAIDSVIAVTPEGLVRSRYRNRPGTTGRVEARVTHRGITRADTMFVRVIDTQNPPVLTTFSLATPAGDSTVFAMQGYAHLGRRTLPITALDENGNPFPDLVICYSSSNTVVGGINRSTGEIVASSPGTVVFYATASAYGVTKRDSVTFRITDKLNYGFILSSIVVTNGQLSMVLHPSFNKTAHIRKGGTVVWYNGSPDTVDIVFDDPSAASKGTQLAATEVPDTSGNIPVLVGDVSRLRSFKTAGTYHWRSLRYPSIRGTVIATD